jgi:hypothetical protein
MASLIPREFLITWSSAKAPVRHESGSPTTLEVWIKDV